MGKQGGVKGGREGREEGNQQVQGLHVHVHNTHQ